MSRTLGLLGNSEENDPIRLLLKHLSVKCDFQLYEQGVESADFASSISNLQSMPAIGAYVLNPYKVDAARAAERFFHVRHAMGLANVLTFNNGVFGQNTEMDGFMEPLQNEEPGTALILGAGQGARMAAMALLRAGWSLRVWNRTATKSRVLASALKTTGPVQMLNEANPGHCKLVVNATPLGKRPGEQPPVLWQNAIPKTIAYDLVYRENVPTEFLRAATARGFHAIDGRVSITGAVALAVEWLLGVQIERSPLLKAIGVKG